MDASLFSIRCQGECLCADGKKNLLDAVDIDGAVEHTQAGAVPFPFLEQGIVGFGAANHKAGTPVRVRLNLELLPTRMHPSSCWLVANSSALFSAPFQPSSQTDSRTPSLSSLEMATFSWLMMPPVARVCKLWEGPGWDMDVSPFPGMAGGVLLLSAKAAEKAAGGNHWCRDDGCSGSSISKIKMPFSQPAVSAPPYFSHR